MELAVTGGIHHLLLLSSVIPSFFFLSFSFGTEWSTVSQWGGAMTLLCVPEPMNVA